MSKVLDKEKFRLPSNVRPIRYEINLSPNLRKQNFNGNVNIQLNNLLKIRELALSNIDLSHLNNNEPYSKIEDILVPIYLLHRYQIEATAKAIGGLKYEYFIKNNKKERIELLAFLPAGLGVIPCSIL